jgi:hypothetical protein
LALNPRFFEFIAEHDEAGDLLPLIHATNAYSFNQICDDGELKADDCDVFNRKTLYFFYGRPAYRTAKGRIGFQAKWSWPIVFVFHPEVLRQVEAVYPFDTGAFHLKYYREFFDDRQELREFDMGNQVQVASKCVSAFYRSNEEYFRNYSTKNVEIDEQDFFAGGVEALLKATQLASPEDPSPRDERSTSIEVQTRQELSLSKEYPLGLVLPQTYARNSRIQDAIRGWNPKYVRYYETLNMQNYEVWHGQIYAKVREILVDAGFLSSEENST